MNAGDICPFCEMANADCTCDMKSMAKDLLLDLVILGLMIAVFWNMYTNDHWSKAEHVIYPLASTALLALKLWPKLRRR